MSNLHQTQLQIINKLIFSKGLRYTQLKPSREMENNIFQFHLNQLTKNNLVQKVGSLYTLTDKGKDYSKTIDTESSKIIKQAHISVRICCTRKHKNNKQYLFYTRLKHPYFGCQGFPAGKLSLGEKIIEGAKRELFEETGLIATPKLVAITHYIDRKNDETVLTDKLMFLCIAQNPKGKLISSNEGKYEWVNNKDITTIITKPFESMTEVKKELKMIGSYKGDIKLIEKDNYNESNY